MLTIIIICLPFRFMEEVDKVNGCEGLICNCLPYAHNHFLYCQEISEMKLSLNARARIVAESYLGTVSAIQIQAQYREADLCQISQQFS
jgi:hypothetical protein